jgi:hypothetical protein
VKLTETDLEADYPAYPVRWLEERMRHPLCMCINAKQRFVFTNISSDAYAGSDRDGNEFEFSTADKGIPITSGVNF